MNTGRMNAGNYYHDSSSPEDLLKDLVLLQHRMINNFATAAGSSTSDFRSFVVEGTSFNPSKGGVIGLSSLPKNCEVKCHYTLAIPVCNSMS